MAKLKEHKNYLYVKAYKKNHGRALMEKYNAHAMGIGWKNDEAGGKKEPALMLYITSKYYLKNKIPTHTTIVLEGRSREIRIPLKVIVSEIAREEES
ncbi:MAG: hypothetical protein ACR2MT_08350 [Aurantibacter sp.]